jgi:biopolymer transport protein ExbD
MARNFRRKQSLSALNELNLTPLMDLVFVLLIIFMVSTPLLEQTIPLNLPLENHSKQVAEPDKNYQVISIDPKGLYFWGEECVSLQLLDERLAACANRKDQPILHIRADAQLPYQKVIDVLDRVKHHQLSKISLDTQPK